MIRKTLLGVVILLLCFAPAAWGGIVLDRVMAIVNKEVITWSDLYKAMEFEAVDAVKALDSAERRKLFKEQESSFLEGLIDMRLQLQEAARLSVAANNEDIERAISDIKKKYSLTDEKFQDAVKREGFTFEEYKKKLAEQITVGRVVEHEIRGKIVVTDSEVAKYIADHKDLGSKSEGFTISHIFLRSRGNPTQLEEKAKAIVNKIKSGERFPDVARQYSEDPTAKAGGELGFIKKADLSREFLNVLSTMKNGEVSDSFWGPGGIHILKLHEKHEIKSDQDLREMVRTKLLDEKFSAEYTDWVKGLRERAYIEIKS